MIISSAFVAGNYRVLVPAATLSLSMIPYCTLYFPIGLASWFLPRRWIQRLDNFLYSSYQRMALFVFENVSAVKIYLYGDVGVLKGREETALVISNHQSDVDWAVITMLAARQQPNGFEHGLRFMLKHVIHYIPLFGWYLPLHGHVYVRRGDFTPKPVLQQFSHLRKLDEPFWLHIFPEGSRYSAKKAQLIAKSRNYCERTNRCLLKHLLAPRGKAFNMAAENMRDVFDAVYDLTLAYTSSDPQKEPDVTRGKAPSMLEFCGARVPYKLHIHLRRIPIAEVPLESLAQAEWLHQRFVEKDRLLDVVYTTGTFPEKEMNDEFGKKLPLYRNFVPFMCFTGAITILPLIFPREVGAAYLATVAVSPLLIGWMHLQKSV